MRRTIPLTFFETAVAYIDFLLATIPLLILMINPVSQAKENVKLAADYRLSIEWPGPEIRSDDIDVYVQAPTKDMMFFKHRDLEGMVTLERDDLGRANDISLYNREEVTFRSPEDGWYFISVHNYRQGPEPVGDARVLFELVDNNGRAVFNGYVEMPEHHQEQIIGSFEVRDGKVIGPLGEGRLISGRVLR